MCQLVHHKPGMCYVTYIAQQNYEVRIILLTLLGFGEVNSTASHGQNWHVSPTLPDSKACLLSTILTCHCLRSVSLAGVYSC